jgi:hypothetical protein
MKDFEIKTEKSEYVLDHEIRSYSALITKRQEWLSKPENKMKSTYNAVKIDTDEMVEKLAELRKDLKEL